LVTFEILIDALAIARVLGIAPDIMMLFDDLEDVYWRRGIVISFIDSWLQVGRVRERSNWIGKVTIIVDPAGTNWVS
jgi:hypothetical protein